MNLVSAVGDVTGDGKGDVLGRLAKDGTTRVYAGDGAGHVAVPGRNATTAVPVGDLDRGRGRLEPRRPQRRADAGQVRPALDDPGPGRRPLRRRPAAGRSFGGLHLVRRGRRPRPATAGPTSSRSTTTATCTSSRAPPQARSARRSSGATVGSAYDTVLGGGRDLTGDAHRRRGRAQQPLRARSRSSRAPAAASSATPSAGSLRAPGSSGSRWRRCPAAPRPTWSASAPTARSLVALPTTG